MGILRRKPKRLSARISAPGTTADATEFVRQANDSWVQDGKAEITCMWKRVTINEVFIAINGTDVKMPLERPANLDQGDTLNLAGIVILNLSEPTT